MTKLRDYSKEQSSLQETVDAYREYKRVLRELQCKELTRRIT